MAITYTAKILLKRGYGDPSTSLDVAELGVDLSTYNLYLGKGVGNQSAKILVGNDPSINDLFNYEVTQDNSINNLDTSINDIWIKINQLDVSADITKEYVDGSLNKLDTSISGLYNEIENIPQDSSISDLYTITNDLSTRITNVDLSINYMSTYIDGSLALKSDLTYVDSSISQVWEYLDEAETASRTIYVDASGNDTTGDGLDVSTAFATIGKALSTIKKIIDFGVVVTIQLGVGTFSLTSSDNKILQSITGGGDLSIQGIITLVESGFTMGSALATDPLTYNVSGGNSATWTANQWKYYLLKSSSNYYPITHNSITPTISIAGPQTGTEIYQIQSTIQLSTTALKGNVNLSILNSNIVTSASTSVFISNCLFKITNCYVSGTGILSIKTGTISDIRRSSFSISVNFGDINNTYQNNYSFINANTTNLFLSQSISFSNSVFENPNTGSSSRCISLSGTLYNIITTTNYCKFVNSNACFSISGITARLNTYSAFNIIIVNSNYFIRKQSSGTSDFIPIYIVLANSQIIGTPNIRWFVDSIYEFINLGSDRNIQIKRLIYPEIEQNLSSTLLNNSTTDISIGHTSQNKSIKIDYTLSRSANGYRAGTFTILSDGSALYMSPDTSTTFISSGVPYVDASAISFSAIRDASIIKLRSSVDSSGGNVTLTYNAFRAMKTPLSF